MLLKDKVAIVTGGATGIGRAIAIRMGGEGAAVVIADMNADTAQKTASEITATGARAVAVSADVTDRAATDRVARTALDHFGKVDVLVNNAGIAGAPGWDRRSESTDEDWVRTYQVNVLGIVNATESVLPGMKAARYGKIVNLSSIAGREGRPALPHYSATKAAVISYTQSLANELAQFSINVNAICPGLLWTPMWEQVGGRYARDNAAYAGLAPRQVFERMVAERIPLGREQTPEDIGEAAAFLASEDARNITGQALNVDGGFFMR